MTEHKANVFVQTSVQKNTTSAHFTFRAVEEIYDYLLCSQVRSDQAAAAEQSTVDALFSDQRTCEYHLGS